MPLLKEASDDDSYAVRLRRLTEFHRWVTKERANGFKGYLEPYRGQMEDVCKLASLLVMIAESAEPEKELRRVVDEAKAVVFDEPTDTARREQESAKEGT